MQGKILIVDAISTNRIVLKVKLASSYYEVVQAATLSEAVQAARQAVPDLVICALALPDGGAGQLCRRLQAMPLTASIPVLAVGSPTDATGRLALLEAGISDVLRHPLDDTLLMARVRSLIRAHNAAAEWQMRDDTSRALGFGEQTQGFALAGKTTLIASDLAQSQNWVARLRPLMPDGLNHARPDTVLRNLSPDNMPDVFVLVLGPQGERPGDMLRLLAAIRANAATRYAGVLVLQVGGDTGLGAQALDLGADDLMIGGFEAAELALRVRALTRRKRIADRLRATVRTGLRAAVSDPLTGLHNRRYAMPHLARVAEHAATTGRPLAVMIADMDHFKRINDMYGHASGDAVLIETARRLCEGLRPVDLVARLGGEEFLIVMPATPLLAARRAAGRLCRAIGDTHFKVPGCASPIPVTVSIGLSIGGRRSGQIDSATALLDEADKALYGAKVQGRNQVTLSRPAA